MCSSFVYDLYISFYSSFSCWISSVLQISSLLAFWAYSETECITIFGVYSDLWSMKIMKKNSYCLTGWQRWPSAALHQRELDSDWHRFLCHSLRRTGASRRLHKTYRILALDTLKHDIRVLLCRAWQITVIPVCRNEQTLQSTFAARLTLLCSHVIWSGTTSLCNKFRICLLCSVYRWTNMLFILFVSINFIQITRK